MTLTQSDITDHTSQARTEGRQTESISPFQTVCLQQYCYVVIGENIKSLKLWFPFIRLPAGEPVGGPVGDSVAGPLTVAPPESSSDDSRSLVTIVIAVVVACVLVTATVVVISCVIHRAGSPSSPHKQGKTTAVTAATRPGSRVMASPLSDSLKNGKAWYANSCRPSNAPTRNGTAHTDRSQHVPGSPPRDDRTCQNGHLPQHNPLLDAGKPAGSLSQSDSVIMQISTL